ncbi:tether containing UBX domain for GLUT4 [Cephus cinctus]|uniref:Tether containing UBX domain for GLUT4 n=1 Tax=Cephus cinctus TaxID=211228 RepID=A0AAJ7BJB5_CEPCN|nr:tether containing UBX domain for GLUT4 [Cephus cinctus]
MAANKSVTVLVPNGRRQNVKVTANTTILQVLEEVCQKHGYNPQEYDVKHYNKVLDVNSIFRFTGLPNNAQLELTACTKPRQESNVTIGIQLESGERLMGDFPPRTPLNQILMKLCPNESFSTAILIYMHREIYGQEDLESTTLKSLGLCSGRAILRLIHRDPSQLKTQAHVYVPSTPKPSKEDNSSEDETRSRPSSSSLIDPHKSLDPITLLRAQKAKLQSLDSSKDNKENQRELIENTNSLKSQKDAEVSDKESSTKSTECIKPNELSISPTEEPTVTFLGERNALLFNQAGAEALPREELPDNFFELTVHDAKALLRDIKKRREELEEAPLQTVSQRELDHNKRTLQQLHKYRRTVIRIQFPDQMVLQGLFGPLETIQTIKDFVKNYLANPDVDFILYTTPPKHILNSEKRLIDEELVPSAILHYSGDSDLKSEIKTKLTDPRAAGLQAVKSRMVMTREDPGTSNMESIENMEVVETTEAIAVTNQEDLVVAGPSRNSSVTENQESSKSGKSQVPKWFKPFK